jgi:hypothetical protein
LHFLWGAGILKRVYPHILQLLREHGESIDSSVPSRFTPTKLDESIHQLAKGSIVPVGETVFPHDLCWGIDDEYGRRVGETEDGTAGPPPMTKEKNSIDSGKGTESVVARSINRGTENFTVKEIHGPILLYQASVSIKDEHVKKD